MQTITLRADYPPKGSTRMADKLLVRGQERKRIKALLTSLSRVQARDGKVSVVEDLASFKGRLVFDEEIVEGITSSVAQIHERLVDLLKARA